MQVWNKQMFFVIQITDTENNTEWCRRPGFSSLVVGWCWCHTGNTVKPDVCWPEWGLQAELVQGNHPEVKDTIYYSGEAFPWQTNAFSVFFVSLFCSLFLFSAKNESVQVHANDGKHVQRPELHRPTVELCETVLKGTVLLCAKC